MKDIGELMAVNSYGGKVSEQPTVDAESVLRTRTKPSADKEEQMNIGKAGAIFNQIDNSDYTAEEKGEAILRVLQMPTHMSITKAAMMKVIWWLLDLAFEIPKDEQPQTKLGRDARSKQKSEHKGGDAT